MKIFNLIIILIIWNFQNIELKNINKSKFCTLKINNCLSCKNNYCLFCDVFNNYFLNNDNKECKLCKKIIKNCIFLLKCASCQICLKGYTLCYGKCIKNLDFCQIGNTCLNICNKCISNYYLFNGKCIKVNKLINYCEDYSSQSKCSKCKIGYILNNNNIQECILDSNQENLSYLAIYIKNCSYYLGNTFTCNSCIKNNFTEFKFYNYDIDNPYKKLEKNIYNKNIQVINKNPPYNFSLIFNNLINKNNICSYITIEGCLEINSKGECLKCNFNYYLFKGICTNYQKSKIKNCNEYKYLENKNYDLNIIDCIKCNDSFYLDIGVCKFYKEIKGCNLYNITYDFCLECNTLKGFKLINNKCEYILNFKIINNCIDYVVYGINEGNCSKCKDNYNLYNNICYTIKNCKKINNFTNPTICLECNSGYKNIENGLKCEKIPDNLNCLLISEKEECEICSNGYFPVNKICVNEFNNRKLISNCIEGMSNWTCKTCKDYHIKIPKIYYCRNPIKHCLFYDEKIGSCLWCGDNRTGSYCKDVGNIDNCIIYLGNICVGCRSDYYSPILNSCIVPKLINSFDMCSNNYVTGYQVDRTNYLDINNHDNKILKLNYICTHCLLNSFLPDNQNTKHRCIPRLTSESKDPYKEGKCKEDEMDLIYNNLQFDFNKTLTCRSIEELIGPRYRKDVNCYIYRNDLTDYNDFWTTKTHTLCAICKSGYLIPSENSQCTLIHDCYIEYNKFGGCDVCTNSRVISISGEECVIPMTNCKIQLNNKCWECNNNYYGVIDSPIDYSKDPTGLSLLISNTGYPMPINFRDHNNIKIPSFRWFYYSEGFSSFNFSTCSNSLLKPANANFTSSKGMTDYHLTFKTSAIINGTDFPLFCKSGYYMQYSSINLNYTCVKIFNLVNWEKLPYNNFFNQVFSKQCDNSKLLIIRGPGGGPFCFNHIIKKELQEEKDVIKSIVGDPLQFYIPIDDKCEILISDWDYNDGIPLVNPICLSCKQNNIIDPNNIFCKDNMYTMITPCRTFGKVYQNEQMCTECEEEDFLIVNNSCVNRRINLFHDNEISTIIVFSLIKNCKVLSWNVYNPGYLVKFVDKKYLPNPKCLICHDEFILDYYTLTCKRPNKFNFKNCLVTEIYRGCVACLNNLISFQSNGVYQFCVKKPNPESFISHIYDNNCEKFGYNELYDYYFCLICKTDFSLKDNICKFKKFIINCKIYLDPETCKICYERYFIKDKLCYKGNIYKCLEYTSQYICKKCDIGYSLWGEKSSFISCININSIVKSLGNNCNETKLYLNNSTQYLYCYCENGRLPLIRSPKNNLFCLPYYIDNCIKYDSHNYTQCIECNSGFYNNLWRKRDIFIIKNNACVLRNKNFKIQNCIIYVNNQAKCHTCKPGYFINKDFLCELNPKGNENCLYPTINGICKLCFLNYYLNSKNICTELNPTNIIDNCYKYGIDQKCLFCNKGYILNIYNKCEYLSKLTFLDPNNLCEYDIFEGYLENQCTCKNKNKYYFNYNTKKCETIINCIIVNEDNTCKQCLSKMYFDNKKCTLISKLILNCDLYSNEKKCIKCSQNYQLLDDICYKIPESDKIVNCNNYINQAKCLLCDPGHSLIEGKCIKLDNENIYYPLSTNNNIALICKPGTIMNEFRNCIISKNIGRFNIIIIIIFYLIN